LECEQQDQREQERRYPEAEKITPAVLLLSSVFPAGFDLQLM
jgi:hypothetical protein